MITRRRAIARLSVAAGGAAMLASPHVLAQGFPDRPLRLITPYAAGGSADGLARGVAEQMRKILGQSVLVDNKPGGNTAVGAQLTAAAAPDGYTLLICTGSTVVTNPLLYPKLSYNPERDLAPVARVAVSPLVVSVNRALPVQTFADLIRLAKAQPGKLNYASTGTGSVLHLASLFLEAQAGLDMTHIPFNGSSPALAAVMGGEVQLFIDSIASSLPQIKGGKLRALAVTTPDRLQVLPDIPTVAESGFPGFDVSAWYGIMAPAKTPPDIIARLNAAIGKGLVDKAFREQFEALGLVIPAPTSPQAYGDYIRQERDKWGPIIKAKKITLE
ncbi:tripartite tricarboxylate transporter substrate binding protein [Polaromonas sp. A23]|uniref:Bug family tripartite tricarboxylate transporter substrate binding protein n=1 Tax=Polaromonas sp. A23 TaxID=1944133 RepID=UPI0009875BC3|nr:tripartite tricarboxylate transporter substrate binding protein [Polaromonas sp. A23]